MNEIKTLLESQIDEAANPFVAMSLHRLSVAIETCDYLQPLAKEMLQRRIRMKFEQRNAASFKEGPCGWQKEAVTL